MRGTVPLLLLTTTLGGGFCTAGFADGCHGPNAPSAFPDPSTATEQDIFVAQESVKHYLTEMETVLKCMESVHNDSARNAAIDDMQRTAAKFNVVLRAYRSRQKA
jgi:hypothetical protein